MRVLVSTTKHVLHLDVEYRAVTVLRSDEPEYYGITWRPGSDGLVLSHSGVDHASMITLEDYALSEQGWLSFPGGSTMRFLSAPHQILWCSDGRVVTSNTGRNRLVALDMERPGYYQEAGLSESRWDRLGLEGPFGDHLNSVFERDGKLYAIAHGHSTGSRLAVFSYPDMRLISADSVPGRTGLHNIYVEGSLQLSCHSEAASLVDLGSQTILWEAGTPIYTRGLAVTDKWVLVGESAKTGRDLRRSSLSGVWLIDRRTWRAVDYFALGPYGAVHEVRVVDEPDFAHHGTPLANPERLLDHTAYEQMRSDRLARSEAASASSAIWRDFDLLSGSNEATQDGWRHGREGLTIVTRRRGAERRWSVDYELRPGGHLSVIYGYDGKGGDANMTALLMQPRGDVADLQEWQENGSGWKSGALLASGKLRSRGRLTVALEADQIAIESEGHTVIKRSLPAGAPDRHVGLRWIDASVRPAEV